MDKSYIVRIYRNDGNSMVGVVEDVETHVLGKFTNAEELWSQISNKSKKDNRDKNTK